VAEGARLEIVYTCERIEGSNPFLSAINGELPKRPKGTVC
jgi:hypothetical protein